MKYNELRKKGGAAPSLEAAIIIGYSVGLKLILGVGAQSMSNIAGAVVGKELCLYALKNGYTISNLDDVEKFFKELNFANIVFKDDADSIEVTISECNICPKRIGGYEFEGTACPWGGILIGFINECLNYNLSVNLDLKPADVCKIILNKNKK